MFLKLRQIVVKDIKNFLAGFHDVSSNGGDNHGAIIAKNED
jgi:hypothetical protein